MTPPIIYNGLFKQQHLQKTLINLTQWLNEIYPSTGFLTSKLDEVFFLSDYFFLGNEMSQYQDSFVVIKDKRCIGGHKEDYEGLLDDYFYINVLSFKKIQFVIETKTSPNYQKTLEFSGIPTLKDIKHCVDIFLSQTQERFIEFFKITFDKEGYATLNLYFKHFEFNTLNAKQRHLMMTFLTQQNKMEEFIALQISARDFKPTRQCDIPQPLTPKPKKVWDIGDPIELDIDDK